MDDRYNACMSDDDCRSQVMDVKDHTYALTKVGVQSTPMPNVAEIIAVLVSNVVAFGVGVLKGKRKI